MAAKKKSPAKKAPAKKTGARKPAARKRPAARKKTAGSGKRGSFGQEMKKIFLGIGILLAICLTAAMLADILINSGTPVVTEKKAKVAKTSRPDPLPADKDHRPGPVGDNRKTVESNNAGTMGPVVADIADLKKKSAGLKEKNGHPIVYEVFDHVDHDRGKPGVRPGTGDDTIPQIAIIIDDIGYDKKVAMGLYDLNPEITFSVLPFSPFGRTLARRLGDRGAELMLHLPMEPSQYPKVNPGPGALLSSMTPDELLDQLRKDINDIPGIIGVNNHMGSKLTTHADQMNQIFTVLRKRNLFFIDSRTAADSKAHAAARLLQLRFSQRDVFLDNIQEIDYITGQFRQLVKIAEKHGTAVGIGHPYPATLKTLGIELPKLKNRIKVVRASRLVAIPG
jgi:polysaccharide deacetylase 2 family uncharacterized protein YibQ